MSANFKPKRTAAASRGLLATARLSCNYFRCNGTYMTIQRYRQTDGQTYNVAIAIVRCAHVCIVSKISVIYRGHRQTHRSLSELEPIQRSHMWYCSVHNCVCILQIAAALLNISLIDCTRSNQMGKVDFNRRTDWRRKSGQCWCRSGSQRRRCASP